MKRILVVDDDTFFLQGFDKALQTAFAEVKAVETGNTAFSKKREKAFKKDRVSSRHDADG